MLKKRFFLFIAIALVIIIAVLLWILGGMYQHSNTVKPIKVGILHSLTGSMAANEQNLVDVVTMAIDEINEQGGVLGRPLQAITYDGKSNENEFAHGAQRLIEKENVAVIFGCWTSASRKAVKPVVEKAKHLLMYPVQYEGLEESSNIFYSGAAPNQQIIPGVTWAYNNLGKRFFVVGSDYIFPRAALAIIIYQAQLLGAEIVGYDFIPLGSNKVQPVIESIKAAKPDVIFNNINGSTNDVFFAQLRAAGITPEKIPTISFSISEPEIATSLQSAAMTGDYAVWNYFQSIYRNENNIFIEKFKKRFGKTRVLSCNMESAYDNVFLWAQAVDQAKSFEPEKVIPLLAKQVFDGPGSIIFFEENHHAARSTFVGKVRFDGQFDIVWDSKKELDPKPYPPYQPKLAWEDFLNKMYKGWGNQWTKPA